VTSADAVRREADWLAAYNSTDGLPALTDAFGGPFNVLQPYWTRTPAARKNQLYVVRRTIRVSRFGLNRKMNTYAFALKIVWPLSSGSGAAEPVQQALDDAIELVIQRINGPVLTFPLDKTHGAQFLSVAEDPPVIDVDISDPEQAVAEGAFKATVTYSADDRDYTA
jgi:hypothetical protein